MWPPSRSWGDFSSRYQGAGPFETTSASSARSLVTAHRVCPLPCSSRQCLGHSLTLTWRHFEHTFVLLSRVPSRQRLAPTSELAFRPGFDALDLCDSGPLCCASEFDSDGVFDGGRCGDRDRQRSPRLVRVNACGSRYYFYLDILKLSWQPQGRWGSGTSLGRTGCILPAAYTKIGLRQFAETGSSCSR